MLNVFDKPCYTWQPSFYFKIYPASQFIVSFKLTIIRVDNILLYTIMGFIV